MGRNTYFNMLYDESLEPRPTLPVWLPALAAPFLFGLGAVGSKALLADMSPMLLAGLLYLGMGLGLGLVWAARGGSGDSALTGPDLPWLGGAVLAGGVIGPALLMLGLSRTTAAAGSLLLNLEAPLTVLLAWLAFGDRLNARLLGGLSFVLAGGLTLSWPEPGAAVGTGAFGGLLVAGACLAWGVDNNLSQKISGKDPIAIGAVKGLAAGTLNTALAMALGARWPGHAQPAWAGLLGFVSYGLSLVFFILALRRIGTTRAILFFSSAPFFGAAAGVVLLHEPLTLRLGAAACLMAAGTALGLGGPERP